ncbi:serine/threonine protein phosphatase [Escherichia coli]|nr:serine/threonine protein phosphatase [Escherichia coli]
MTGKEAIIHYLGTHNSFCAPDVAALTGATVTSINQAAAKMARAGLLVIEGKVWRTVYYRFATREEREGKMSTNLIFKECRQSAAMKRVITFPWFRAVRGNHEQMMIDGLSERGNVNHWLLNGGGWFFNLDYDKETLAKVLAHKAEELPLIIELVSKDKKYVICHADYPCDKYEFGKPVDHQQVIWNRERISNSQDGIVKEIKGADTFIFGHTPAVKPLKFANQMYIDTGAVFCGNLALIQVQGEGA